MRILTEAAGCLTAGYLIKAVKESGNISIATDAGEDCFGKYLADEFYQVPFATAHDSKDFLFDLCVERNIDIVIPTLDDSLLTWSNIAETLKTYNTTVAISKTETLQVFLDKWESYLFFKKNDIPTPETSLEQKYLLVKPRLGRGGAGIQITDKPVSMEGNISQQLIEGTEYTIDVFCDQNGEPIYIVPRVRLGIKDGKSTGGIVVENSKIDRLVKKICRAIPFWGPINIQCFETQNNEILITEINPRLGGGSVLGMAATENWMELIVKMCNGENVSPNVPVKYGLKMGRYYEQVFYF